MAGAHQRTYTSFAGGQNNNAGEMASPIILDMGQGTQSLTYAHSSVNWEMAENGLLKHGGDDEVVTTVTTTSTVTGLYDWNGTTIKVNGTKVYTVSGSSETAIYTGLTADKFVQFTEYDDGSGTEILIMCNGTDVPLYYDGTTCTTITFTDDASPIWDDARPQGATVNRGNIYYWGDPTHPHRVYKPRPDTYNNFDNTTSTVDAFDVDAGFGGVLTGLKTLTDNIVIVYKERAIRRLSGSTPFGSSGDPLELRPISDEFGCIAPRSIVQVGVDQYFLSESGLRRLKPVQDYGDIDPQTPTYPIQEVMDGLNYTSTVIKNACAIFHKPSKQVWLSVPNGSSTTNNLIIHHDVVTGSNELRRDDDITASCLAEISRKIYHGGYNGQVYKHGDTYNYHGTTIDASWESKWITHHGMGLTKAYRELHLYVEADGVGSLIVQYAVLKRGEEINQSSANEIQATNSQWDTAQWDSSQWAGAGQAVFKLKNLGRGKALKIRFVNTANNQRVKVRQVDLFFDIFGTAKG